MKAALALIGGVRAAIFLGLALAALVAVGIQTHRLSERTEERDLLQAQAALWEQANRDNVQAIADLKAANTNWADAARAGADKARAAADRLADERARHAQELEEARRERGTIYANDPNAAAWGRARVPARIADQLRR